MMIVGDFGEDYEIMVPFQALQAVGHVLRPCVRQARRADGSDLVHDFEGDQTYLRKAGHAFVLNATFADSTRLVRCARRPGRTGPGASA